MKGAAQLRVRLIQMEIQTGRPWTNTDAIIDHVRAAVRDKVQIVVFPEMAIPGYLIGDEWEYVAFLRECEECGDAVRKASQGVISVFGNVAIDRQRRNEDGRLRKYNAIFVAEDGRFCSPQAGPYDFVVKTLMPNYRQFDDSRHFYDARKLALEEGTTVEQLTAPVKTRELLLGCSLCEDAWDSDYSVSPLDLLSRTECDLYINISASPFTFNKRRKRDDILRTQAIKLKRPLVYVNNVGIQNNGKTVFTFDGGSAVYDSHGNASRCSHVFAPQELTVDIPPGPCTLGNADRAREDDIGDIYQAVDYGTRRFMTLCNVKKVTVGISGGIDSAVVASVYRRIVEPRDLLLVSMPGDYTSETTRRLARSLAENLGCLFAEFPIKESVKVTRRQIDGVRVESIDGGLSDTLRISERVLENIQARDRSSRILAAVSAAFGGVFTCNANKAEATVGYTTLYGDLCGYLANIADLWKMEVYRLARHMNENVYQREVIPEGILNLTPSAELSAEQDVDKGKGDPFRYEYHDLLFKSWVERWDRATPEDILYWYREGELEGQLGYDGSVRDLFPGAREFVEDLERWWIQYQGIGLAKRIQAPPVIAVKRRAFGFDYRESQMGPRFTKRYQELRKEVLDAAG